MKTKKVVSITIAAIMSISSLLCSVQEPVSAYRMTSDYVLEEEPPHGLLTGEQYAYPSDQNQRVYIRYNKNNTVHYKVLASDDSGKFRLYYDERYDEYVLTSTSTFTTVYEYDLTSSEIYNVNIGSRAIRFKPQSGVTVGGWDNVYLNGDVNFDHQINVTDVTLVAAHVKGKKKLKGDALKFANVCHETNPDCGGPDDTINISDLTLISAYAKGKNVRL